MARSATYYEHLQRASSILLVVMAQFNRVDVMTIMNIDWIGRRYRRILEESARQMGISYPGPGLLCANSSFDQAADYLVELAEKQTTAESTPPKVPTQKQAKATWRMIEHIVLKALSERCGKRIVDLSSNTLLGEWAGAVDEAVGKVLQIGLPRGFTAKTTIASAAEKTIEQRIRVGAMIAQSPKQPAPRERSMPAMYERTW